MLVCDVLCCVQASRRTLVVVNYISQVISSSIMRFAHTHRVVSKIDIAVIACKESVEVGTSLKFGSSEVEGLTKDCENN